jgi:Zn-dependent peptidase ImmA (M78 family)/transcriptional regulator with XRE-family HTH domain
MSAGILPGQLRRARETIRLPIHRAAKMLSVPLETLEAWEGGTLVPDDERLWDVAELYGRPVSYFYTETGSPPPHQDFRSSPAIDLETELATRRAVVARFEELCRLQARLEALSGEPRGEPLLARLRSEASHHQPPERLAEWLRGQLGLGNEPIKNLEVLIEESLGVRLFVVDIPGATVSGTSWWHDEFGPAMLVNRRDGSARRSFTMAHELGHMLRPSGQPLCGFLVGGPVEEADANAFAAAFLMPSIAVRSVVSELEREELISGWLTPDRGLDRLARRFGVSREAASWRLERLGVLPRGFTATRRALWDSRPRIVRARGPRWRRRLSDLGQRHVRLAQRAYANHQISLSVLADALLIDDEQAYTLAELAD